MNMIAIPLRTALFGLTIALTAVSPLTAMGQANPGLGAIQPTQTQEQQQGVVINGVVVTPHQLKQLGVQAGQIQPGKYWYDAATGAWGLQGSGVQGFIQPGLQVGGALQANASNGRTGVYINGRQLPQSDLIQLQQAVGGQVPPGRYWCQANGNCGQEGNPQPLINLRNTGGNRVNKNGTGKGYNYSVDGEVGGCFEGAGGKMVCFDSGIGSSSY